MFFLCVRVGQIASASRHARRHFVIRSWCKNRDIWLIISLVSEPILLKGCGKSPPVSLSISVAAFICLLSYDKATRKSGSTAAIHLDSRHDCLLARAVRFLKSVLFVCLFVCTDILYWNAFEYYGDPSATHSLQISKGWNQGCWCSHVKPSQWIQFSIFQKYITIMASVHLFMIRRSRETHQVKQSIDF